MELTSLDYIKLISWLAFYKHSTILNKTQMQKLLFICYGLYYVRTGKVLFKDDTPKAWPFGPVFPRSYKRYVEVAPNDLSQEEKKRFLEDKETLIEITHVVDTYYMYSAVVLSEWSHQTGSPWAITVLGDGKTPVVWNKVISNEIIKHYFSNESWKNGL